MARNTISLHRLEIFEAAGRLASFKEAASEMFMTPSAVSQSIKRLEDELQCPLFVRHHQKVTLTQAGERLLAELQTNLANIFKSVEAIRHSASTSISLSSPPLFANQIIIPVLQQMLAEGIAFDFQLDSHYRGIGQMDRASDIVIAYGKPENTEAVFEPVGMEVFVAVCSAQYRNAVLETKAEKATWIVNDTDLDIWKHWREQNRFYEHATEKCLHFSMGLQAKSAALSGLGILIESTAMIAEPLNSGLLVEAFAAPVINHERERHFIHLSARAEQNPLALQIKQRILHKVRPDR
ncbi:MAG: HTH-type transcriptional regulator PerR [Pseudomonas fluorescens]|nr:MAG: HTH-type transcriptional regulator PerR [Pseudomonas fluorescens]